jgi:predicted acyltransferase
MQESSSSKKGKGFETISKLLLAGILLIFIAMCLNPVFPINKKLWTSTFVLLTCGLDLLIIGSLIYLIEVLSFVKWTGFFTILGKNPLAIYLLSEIILITIYTMFPSSNVIGRINNGFFQTIAPGPVGSLLFAVCFMLLCWTAGYVLDKRKIYIRI